jgi:hypothetical protein
MTTRAALIGSQKMTAPKITDKRALRPVRIVF